MKYCSHRHLAVLGRQSAPGRLEGVGFTKCTNCWEERNFAGKVTMPASAYTEKPISWAEYSTRTYGKRKGFWEAAGLVGGPPLPPDELPVPF